LYATLIMTQPGCVGAYWGAHASGVLVSALRRNRLFLTHCGSLELH
jgi:hypothetical protein